MANDEELELSSKAIKTLKEKARSALKSPNTSVKLEDDHAVITLAAHDKDIRTD